MSNSHADASSVCQRVVACLRTKLGHGGVGYELARDALREWLRRGGKPSRLMEIASRLPRAKSPILQALDMLG